MTLSTRCVMGGIGLGVAAGIAYLATRGTGPVKLTQYTEERSGPVQGHLATEAELGFPAPPTQHRYPAKLAPGLSQCITHGFAPLYRLSDPQVAALPAESD